MSTIIHFNPPQRAAASAATIETLPPCEIVIFPGVRIERDETAPTTDVPARKTNGSADHGSRPRKSS